MSTQAEGHCPRGCYTTCEAMYGPCELGEQEITAEEVDRCRQLVNYGEAITFPNGLTIDKRPLVYPPAHPAPTHQWNQWQS